MREPSRHDNRIKNLQGAQALEDLSNLHQGMISNNARSKMINAILWLEAQADFKWCYSKTSGKWFRWKLNFIHLTLPAQGNKSDKFIKKLLNTFFLYAFRKTGLRTYVWKAEPQQRGEIHFHITADCFIWRNTLRNIWNGILRKHGLLNGHEDPPSTKVHPTHNINNMCAYLIKYMTKNDEGRRTIQGRLWGCSRNLSQAKNIFFTMEEAEAMHEYNSIKVPWNYERNYDYISIKLLSPMYFENLEPSPLLTKYRERVKEIRTGYAPTKNFLFDESGNPITYEQAQQKNFSEINKFLYEQQIKFAYAN